MSILDFTTDLFRDPAALRAFIEDPDQSLRDAGLPGATPEQVYHLLPMVAESMSPEHPLQSVVHSTDPHAALQELDVESVLEDVESEAHLQGRIKAEGAMDAVSGKTQVQPHEATGLHAEGDIDSDRTIVVVETVGKGLGQPTDTDHDIAHDIDYEAHAHFITIVDDPSTPEIEVEVDRPGDAHAVEHDVGHHIDEHHDTHAAWGKEID